MSNFTKDIKVKNSYFRPNAISYLFLCQGGHFKTLRIRLYKYSPFVSKSSRKVTETVRKGSNSERPFVSKSSRKVTETVRKGSNSERPFSIYTKEERRQNFQHFCENLFNKKYHIYLNKIQF